MSWTRSSRYRIWIWRSVVPAEAFDGCQDVIGGLSPAERLGIGVVPVDEGSDVCPESGNASIEAASDLLVGQECEEAHGKCLVIEWDDAQEICQNTGTGPDKLRDFTRYAITTLLNDVGVPSFNAPSGLIDDITHWLIKSGGAKLADANSDGSITSADCYVLDYNNSHEPGKDGFSTTVKASSTAWQTGAPGIPSGSEIFATMNALTDGTSKCMVVDSQQTLVTSVIDEGSYFGLLGVAPNNPDEYLHLMWRVLDGLIPHARCGRFGTATRGAPCAHGRPHRCNCRERRCYAKPEDGAF